MMSDGSEVKKSGHVKVAFASLIGTAIEWYDFFLYGTSAALVFNKLFFPSFDPVVGTLMALVTFAVGFIARPFGGIIFGHFGDRIGRKTMLYLTLLIMGLATAIVGLIPTYNEIGIWAPILLVTMRILQGIGLGGEWGGAVLMAYEHAPANRRGFYGSWPQLGAPLGLVLGNVVFMIFSNAYPGDLYTSTWAWRMPFLFSFALVVVGLYIRMQIAESPQFEKIKEAKQESKMPLIEAITQHPKNLLLAMGARFAENGLFYIYATFSLVYVTTVLKMPRMTILTAILIAAFVESFTIPFFGFLSDKVGRRPVYMGGAIFSGLWAFPLFYLLDLKSPEYMIVAIAVGMAIGHSAMYGPQASFMSELFSTRVRYSGASLGYQLASIFAGGISPLIATYLLKQSGGNPTPIAWYMIVLAAITVVSVFLAAESYKTGGEQ
jgi:MFS transporter, MHS family, shikimate and dehydroshikimate transport protein